MVPAVNEFAGLARLEFCRAAARHAILSADRRWPARAYYRRAVVMLGPATTLSGAAVVHVGLVMGPQPVAVEIVEVVAGLDGGYDASGSAS